MNKGLIAAVMGSGALVLAPAAHASTVTVTGGSTMRVLESGDETNRIAVSYDAAADRYAVTDAGANLTPSGTCTAVSSHTATCPGAGIKTVSVDTDARDDSIALDPATIPDTVTENLDGGGGNDQVSGGPGPGTLQGGSGNDTVMGGRLHQDIRGGSGRDLLDGGDGPDDIQGGSGTDTLVYTGDRRTTVVVSIGFGDFNDGGGEDQGPGGRETVHGDVEVVIGTELDDILIGDGSSETLDGAAGNDTVIGNDGNDTLFGLEGNDVLVAGRGGDLLTGWLGDDRLFGGPGNDRVRGGPGNDFLVGNPGHDAIKGKGGIDAIRAKDGTRDVKISCGRGPNGRESATRDKRLDPRAKSC
jgi:Ca2+-binding RTX toxin-like protein